MPCLPHLIHSKTVLLHSQSGVPLLQLQDPFLTTGLFSATSSSKLGKIWLLRPPRLGGRSSRSCLLAHLPPQTWPHHCSRGAMCCSGASACYARSPCAPCVPLHCSHPPLLLPHLRSWWWVWDLICSAIFTLFFGLVDCHPNPRAGGEKKSSVRSSFLIISILYMEHFFWYHCFWIFHGWQFLEHKICLVCWC